MSTDLDFPDVDTTLTADQIDELEALSISLQSGGELSQEDIDAQLEDKRNEFLQRNKNNPQLNPTEQKKEKVNVEQVDKRPEKKNENAETNTTDQDSDETTYYNVLPETTVVEAAQQQQKEYDKALNLLDKNKEGEEGYGTIEEDEEFEYESSSEGLVQFDDVRHSSLVDKDGNPITIRKSTTSSFDNVHNKPHLSVHERTSETYEILDANGNLIGNASQEQIETYKSFMWMKDFREKRQKILDNIYSDDVIEELTDGRGDAYDLAVYEADLKKKIEDGQKRFDFSRDYQENMDLDGDGLVDKEEIEAKMDTNKDGEVSKQERVNFEYWYDNEYSINQYLSLTDYANEQNAAEFDKAYKEFHLQEDLKFKNLFEEKFESAIQEEVQLAQEAYTAKFKTDQGEIVSTVQESVKEEIQALIDSGVIDETWTQDMINSFANEKYSEQIKPHFDKWNKDNEEQYQIDLEKRLNPIQEGLADEINAQYKASAQKFIDSYVDPLTPSLVGEENFKKIDEFLDNNGFAYQNFKTKKAILGSAWDIMSRTIFHDLGLTNSKELMHAKDEFMKRYYKKLLFDEENNLTNFALKDRAYELFRDVDEHIGKNEAKIKAFKNKYPEFMQYLEAEDYRPPKGQEDRYKELEQEYDDLLREKDMLRKTNEFARNTTEKLDPEDLENNSGFTNFLNGLFSGKFADYIPFISGLSEMGEAAKMLTLATKDRKHREEGGPALTKAEQAMLTAYTVNNQVESRLTELSQGYRTGKMTGEMIPYLFEMAMTSGIFTAARAGTKKFLTNRFKKYTTDQVARYAKMGYVSTLAVGKTPVKVAMSNAAINGFSFMIGSMSQAAANPQQYVTKTFQNMTPEMKLAMTTEGDEILNLIASFSTKEGETGMDAFEAAWKSYGTTWAEFATERFGASLPWIGKQIGKPGGFMYKKVKEAGPRFLQGMMLGRWMKNNGYKTAKEAMDAIKKANGRFAKSKIAEKIGYNGFVGEIYEELINLPLQNMIEGNDLFDTGNQTFREFCEDLGITIGAMTSTGGLVGAGLNMGQKTPVYEVNVTNNKKNIQEARKFKTKEEQMEYIQSLDLKDKDNKVQVNIVNDNNAFIDMNDHLIQYKRTKDLVNKPYEKQNRDALVARDLEIKRRISRQDPAKVKEIEKNEDKISGLQSEIDSITDGRKTWRKKAEIQKLQNINKAIIQDSGVIEDMKEEKYFEKVRKVKALAPQVADQLGMDIEVLETDTDGIREFTWQEQLEQRGIIAGTAQTADRRFTGNTRIDEDVYVYEDGSGQVGPDVMNEIQSLVNEAMDERVHGFISDPLKTEKGKGTKRTIVINKENALKGNAVNVAGHEFLHALLFNALNNNPATAMAMGKTLENYLIDLDFSRIKDSEFRQRLFDYQTDPNRSSQSFEETFSLFSDAIANGDIKYNEGMGTRIGDTFRRVLRAAGAPVKFANGRDAFNFVKDFNYAVEHGKVRQLKTLAKGITLEGRMAQQRDLYQEMWDNLSDEQQQQYKFSRDPKQFENTIQKMYNDPNMDKNTKAFLIARAYDPRVKYNVEGFEDPSGTRTAGGVRINKELSKYSNLPDFKTYKNDITDEILDGVPERREGESTEDLMKRGRSIRSMVLSYDPSSNVPLTGYIGSILSKRGISEQVSKFIQEDAGFKVDLAETRELEADQPYVAPRERKTIKLSEKLGPKAKAINKKVKQDMKGVDFSSYNIKTLKDLTPELTAEMFGIPVKKLLSGANLTKGELAKAQMFINKHADVLYKMLPEGTTASGTSTGVQNTLLKAFYNKQERAKMSKTGAKSGLSIQVKRSDITRKDFLEVFGIIDGKPIRSDRNISARVLALATQTGKALSNQAIREQMIKEGRPLEAMRTLVDGKSPYMFSRGALQPLGAIDRSIRGENAKAEFWSRMGSVADAYIIESDPKSLEIALTEIYNDIPAISNSIPELSNALFNALEALSPKIKTKNPHIKSSKLIDALIERNLKAEETVKNFFRSDKPVKAMFKDPVLRRQYIAIDKMFAVETWDPKNIEQSIRMIKQMQDHSTTSPSRSQAYYDRDKNNKPRHAAFWTEQIWGTIKAQDPKLDYKLNAKGGINYKSITYDGKAIDADFAFSANTSEKALEDAKKGLDKRKKDESDAQLLLNSYIEFWSNKYKEGKITNNHLAMVAGALLSNMDTSLARAATLKYVSTNAYDFKNPGQELKYEHLQPRVAVLIKLFDAHLNGDGIADISKFLENYNIQIIPDTMDKVINESGLQSRLYEGQTLDMPSWIRTFNAATRENANGRMVPLRDVNTGEILEPSQAFVDGLAILNGTIKQQQSAFKLSRAVVSSRVPRPVRGITVLDFDDTLATTKSGVRARIPNPDGTPKPSRKAILLAGGAGSGKSNVVKQLGLVENGFKVVNQDIALEWLKKNAGIPTDMRDLTREQMSTLGKLGHQARMIAKRKYGKFKGNGNGVVVDGTGGSVKTIQKQKQELEAAGYDVQMLFVETSLDVALDRNRNRKERSLRDSIVKRNHESVQNNKPEFKKMFGEGFIEVNTDNLKQNDPMPPSVSNKISTFVNSYEKRRLDAEEFALEGADILEQGGEFDFSEFNIVVEGQTAPLFNKALKLQKKFGPKDMFVLTARPAESAPHIFEFLKANGLNIPLENITGLANSTPEAKALWMADKVAEGYNDFYFADDALQNVQAVKNMLDQFDVKSKVQQAKLKFSKGINEKFNDILEQKSGVESQKVFSQAKGKIRGKGKGRFRFFVPPSAEDFKGLLYSFLPSGAQGDQALEFFKEALLDPYAKGYRELNSAKQQMSNDYNALRKANPDVRKQLSKKIEGQKDYRYGDAVRVYLWNKAGYTVPGLSKTDLAKLLDVIENDAKLKAFADNVGLISKRPEGYVEPSKEWLVGNILSDLDGANKVNRKEFLAEWIENKNIIFSEENLNKIEAIYGPNFREALEDMLWRMENGTNRKTGSNRIVNQFQNWVNNSVGTIMFFNSRSAILQTLSSVNFINWGDNNIAKAALAFANQPQFWKDFATLFNSDMLKQRRKGLKTDVNHAELAEAVGRSKNPVAAALNWLLQKGFLPTQMADSFAIASGGATFYRNRIKTYLKQGMSKKQAEQKAFEDFQEIAEETQQSSRPDLISQQQASVLGRIILAFQNTPMQYTRLIKKSALDLANNRGDWKTNVSRIVYYGAVQNIIFYSLQSALFALAFDDDEEEETSEAAQQKKLRIANGMVDSILRGTGVYGAVVSTIKNTIIKLGQEQNKDGWRRGEDGPLVEALNLSPPIGSKARKFVSAQKSWNYNEDVIKKMDKFDIDNPLWEVVGNVVSMSTNVPLDRLVNKVKNVRAALDDTNETWQRVALMLGWNRWDVNVKSEKLEEVKEEVKQEKKIQSKKRREEKKIEKEKIKAKENEELIKKNIELSKKDGICSAINKHGKRCGKKIVKGKHFCTIHEKVERNETGEKARCKKIKSNGKQCGMMTNNKSGYCYYHD